MESITNSIATQFNNGGPFMWVILIVLAFSVSIAMERFIYYFFVIRTNSREIVSKIVTHINNNELEVAKKLVENSSKPVLKLIYTAVDSYTEMYEYDEIQERVEEVAILEVPKLSKRLNYLALFANIATLLGLLGTIAGLQVSFSSLAGVEAAQKASLLAAGISQAMNTTAFGLIVAVPCMIFFTMLTNKKNDMTKNMDESVVKLLNFMKRKLAHN